MVGGDASMKRARPALSVDDWIRLNRLLEQGLDLDESERNAWLERLTAEAANVRAVLFELIGQASASASARESGRPIAIARVASDALAALHPDHPGHQIGPWRLERLLAEGGMGTVWLAERVDGVMRRTAALKLPRSEWVDRGLTDRIARERAILARLQHPNIAVLYDAGVTTEGRPFLALEYVEGEPIDAYCGRQRLDLRSLLQLFLPVVRAVAYAHSRLIIHRDIKPGNILVTPGGQPKLLDFGVSKLIEGDQTAAGDTTLTKVAGRPLTLPYAAPEQLEGSSATVSLDIYALGVVLFELATGARLYRSTTPYALEQEILAGDLRRPSDVATDRRRRHQLHGDLDAIVLNALKRQPEERYASAAALADDIERFLAGQPVAARPLSHAYRLRKFVSRHRLPVVAAASIVLALGGGAGLALWQATIAREQATEATALNTFVFSLIKHADPYASQQTRQADLVMLAAIEERIDRNLLGSPAQRLRLRVTLGEAYRNRGQLIAAQRAYRRAVDDAGADVPADDLHLLQAHVRAADPLMIASMQDADRLVRAIEFLRAMGSAGAELLIDALINLHLLSEEFGVPAFTTVANRFDALGEALDVATRHFGEGTNVYLRALLAYALLVDAAGDRLRAREMIEQGLAQARQRPENFAASAEYRSLEEAHHAYLCGTERADEGAAGLWRAFEFVRAHHDEASLQMERTYAVLGLCYDRMGDTASLGFLLAAYDVAAAREQPPSLQLMRRAVGAMEWAVRLKDVETAQEYRRRANENALAVADPVLRARLSRPVAMSDVCLLHQSGKLDEAERAANEALRTWREQPGARLTYPEVMVLLCLSYAQREVGRYDDAAQTAQDLLALCRDYGESGVPRCRNRGSLALAWARLDGGNPGEALAILEERLKLPLRMDLNPESALARGRALLEVGRIAEATALLKRLQDHWRASLTPESAFAAEANYWLGRAYVAAGDRRGESMIAEAKRVLVRSPLPSHRKLAASAPHESTRTTVRAATSITRGDGP
jgi:serine/threonine protein kinase